MFIKPPLGGWGVNLSFFNDSLIYYLPFISPFSLWENGVRGMRRLKKRELTNIIIARSLRSD